MFKLWVKEASFEKIVGVFEALCWKRLTCNGGLKVNDRGDLYNDVKKIIGGEWTTRYELSKIRYCIENGASADS